MFGKDNAKPFLGLLVLLLMAGCAAVNPSATPAERTIPEAAQSESMTYVLVHGAFQNSAAWDEVAPLLEERGHTAIALDLPGHGSDETPLGEVALVDYRNAVIETIEARAEPVVLVGHSMGGIVISEVAEAIPDRIDSLIYVAGYIPRTGDSLASLAEEDMENGFNETNFLLAEDFSHAYIPEDQFLDLFCGDCTEAQGEQVLATQQEQPLTPLNDPATVTEENFGQVRKVYIHTLQDNAASPQIQELMLSRTPVDEVVELDTSHVPFITMPEALANLLVRME